MEGETHYERIIGGTQEQKDAALQELQLLFDERSEELAKYEIEKTPEDLEILGKVELIVDKIVAQYGGTARKIPVDHIYVFREGSVSEMSEGRIEGGVHQPLGLKIGVERKRSKLMFASSVAHELFRFKSYKSARVGKSGEGVRLYRTGLLMVDTKDSDAEYGKEREYFGVAEEAVVAECTRKFIEEISKNEEFREEAEAIARFKEWVLGYYRRVGMPEEKAREFERELVYILDPQDKVAQVLAFSDDETRRETYAAGLFRDLYEREDVEVMERYEERRRLYELLDRLVENSRGRFKNRDEVFDEFAKANFSGHYLSLVRTVEGILGKGSFRRLAEEFS